MKNIIPFIILIFGILISSCKKEGAPGPQGAEGPAGPAGNSALADPAIYTKWEVVSGMDNARYVCVKTSNIVFRLDSAAYGFKHLFSDLALITHTQIKVFGEIFNYAISSDTLTMSNLLRTCVLKRNTAAPDETQWVIMAGVSDSIPNPTPGEDGRQDIGFDGTNILWTGKSNSNILYKINPMTHSVTSLTLAGTYYYSSACYAGGFLWLSDQHVIYKVNPTTGAVISTSPTLSTTTLTGLALVGTIMYYVDWSGNIGYWDTSNTNLYPLINKNCTGMEYVNGYIYLFGQQQVYKCQVNPFHCLESYYVGPALLGYNCGGITFDGNRFWVVGRNEETGDYKLVKLSI